ncbi:MAG: sulfatase-like hydrolase/transferase [bacterium]
MNVVLIIVDTLRQDHVGCYGNRWIKTPYLDSLAKESVLFTHAYAVFVIPYYRKKPIFIEIIKYIPRGL